MPAPPIIYYIGQAEGENGAVPGWSKWRRWAKLCQALCGRDARAPRKSSSHDIAFPLKGGVIAIGRPQGTPLRFHPGQRFKRPAACRRRGNPCGCPDIKGEARSRASQLDLQQLLFLSILSILSIRVPNHGENI